MLLVPILAAVTVLADRIISVHAFLDGMRELQIAHSERVHLVQHGQIKRTPQTKLICLQFVAMQDYVITKKASANVLKVSQVVHANVACAPMTAQDMVHVYQ